MSVDTQSAFNNAVSDYILLPKDKCYKTELNDDDVNRIVEFATKALKSVDCNAQLAVFCIFKHFDFNSINEWNKNQNSFTTKCETVVNSVLKILGNNSSQSFLQMPDDVSFGLLHLFSFNPPIMGGFLSEKATLLCALSMRKGVKKKVIKELNFDKNLEESKTKLNELNSTKNYKQKVLNSVVQAKTNIARMLLINKLKTLNKKLIIIQHVILKEVQNQNATENQNAASRKRDDQENIANVNVWSYGLLIHMTSV